MNASDVNFFDVVTLLVGLWAVVAGWRRGVILQLGSLLGILLSLFLASRYGADVGHLLHLGEGWLTLGGFIIVALVTLMGVALLGRLARKLFQFAGLGVVDILLGILISLVKWLLLLSAIYTAFGALNRNLKLVEESALNRSRTFAPVCRVADYVMPYIHRALDEADSLGWIPEAEPKPQSPTEDGE